MNKFQAPFSAPEWGTVKAAFAELVRSFSVWLNLFPQKEVSILLIILGVDICLGAAQIILFNFKHNYLFEFETLLSLIVFIHFARLTLGRIKMVRTAVPSNQ
jgi:hypothetical protein